MTSPPSGEGTCTGGTCITNMTLYNITGLMYGMTYTVMISANNSVGAGEGTSLSVAIPGNGNFLFLYRSNFLSVDLYN